MKPEDYNPHSPHAMFATIMTKMDAQDRATALYREEMRQAFYDVRLEASKNRHRIVTLEHEKWYQRGVVASIAFLVAPAWEWAKTKIFHG